MISVTVINQCNVDGTSKVTIQSIKRSNEPYNSIEEYIRELEINQLIPVTHCRYSNRYTIQYEHHRLFIFDSMDFGSHWRGRPVDLNISDNFTPQTLELN